MGTTRFDRFGLVKFRLDADRNGIHDSVEGAGDLDGDGLPNAVDWDDDGDRVADATESICDDDGDGLFASQDTDRDGDGVLDGIAECQAGAECACGFRQGPDRVLCVEGEDAQCVDGDLGAGPVEFEVVPVACPEYVEGYGATCTSEDLGLHFYGERTDPHAEVFCGSCDAESVEPAGFCG